MQYLEISQTKAIPIPQSLWYSKSHIQMSEFTKQKTFNGFLVKFCIYNSQGHNFERRKKSGFVTLRFLFIKKYTRDH